LDSFSHFLLLYVVDDLLLDHSGNILGLIFYSIEVLDSLFYGHNLCSRHLIIFGDHLLDRNLFHPFDLIVLHVALLVRNVFHPALSWDVLNDGLFVDGWCNSCGTH